MRAFVFTRVSTPDQSDNFSIPSQLKRVYSYLEKNDLFIQSPKDIYQVVETASRRHERKTFKEMLKRVEELNSVVALVFDTIDRGALWDVFRTGIMSMGLDFNFFSIS